MDFESRKTTRRGLLIGTVLLGGLPILAAAGSAEAAGALPKANAKYQNHPNGGKRCALCNYYIAGPRGGMGQCKVVAGAISPDGWCELFAFKA